MIVELVTTGSELLLGQIINTNSSYMARELNSMVGLINNPDLTRESVAEYEAGLLSFQQWPTTAANGSTQNAKNTKNSKKKK